MLKFRYAVGAVAVFVGLNFGRAADDTFDLRGPAPQKDQQYVTTGKLIVKDADAKIKRGADEVKFKLNLTATLEEAVTVLDVSGREVTKSQTKVVKDRVETTGLAKDATYTETSVLEKETLLSTRDGKNWKHTLADGKPTDSQLKDLGERNGTESDDGLYPVEKVKVGHAWAADVGAFNKVLGHALSDMNGKLNQKFVKVEVIDGEQVAVIESTGKVSGKMKGNGDQPLDAEIELTHTTWKSLKTGLAVRERFEGTLKLTGRSKEGDTVTEVDIRGPISGESETKLAEKK